MTDIDITLPEWLQSPVATASAVAGGLVGLFNPEIVYAAADALFVSAPQIFGGVTVATLTLPQFLPPETTADWLGVSAALLFGAYLLWRINENFDKEGL